MFSSVLANCKIIAAARQISLHARKKSTLLSVLLNLEVAPGFEPGIKVLQTYALPLGYATKLAGVEGFEPPDGGIRIHCLTTWRYPYVLLN